MVLALLRAGDRYNDLLGRHDLGEHRRRWGEVGRPIRDSTRSVRVPEVSVEVAVLREALCVEVEDLIFVRDGAGGRPGQVHGHRERIARHDVEDRNSRVQACRDELFPDLEISVGSKAEGSQQQHARAYVKLLDNDVGTTNGLLADGVLMAVDRHGGVDTAIGTRVVEGSEGGQAMEPEHDGGSRCCMGSWGASGESEGYEGQQQNE